MLIPELPEVPFFMLHKETEDDLRADLGNTFEAFFLLAERHDPTHDPLTSDILARVNYLRRKLDMPGLYIGIDDQLHEE